MKQIFLSLIFFSFLSAQVENDYLKITNDTARQLTESMYNFFTETLENNYKASNEQGLYENFLYDFHNKVIKLVNDYYNVNDSSSMGSIPDFRLKVLKVNKHKLVKINKKLFVRDSSHYYYFFAEVLLMPDWDSAKALKLTNLNFNIPLAVLSVRNISNKPALYPTFYEAPAVLIDSDRGIVKDIQKVNLKTSLYIDNNVQFYRTS